MKCKYNTNTPDYLFTKESLDERWQQVGKGTIKKQEKEKQAQQKQESGEKSGTSSSN